MESKYDKRGGEGDGVQEKGWQWARAESWAKLERRGCFVVVLTGLVQEVDVC